MATQNFDSIYVTNLPKNMLNAELKSLVLGHFANFGHILRISVAKYKDAQRGHIQYAIPGEAVRAEQQGEMMRGSRLQIALTSKPPSTKVITVRPRADPSTLQAPLERPLAPPPPMAPIQRPSQSSIRAYLNNSPSPSPSSVNMQVRKEFPVTRNIPSVNSFTPTSSSPTQPLVAAHSPGIHIQSLSPSSIQTPNPATPNTCVKIEVYRGGASQTSSLSPVQSNPTASTTINAAMVAQALNAVAPPTLQPTKTLSEILNLDTSRMKVIDTVTASDALASQFMQNGSYPFPIAAMFGRRLGTPIIPTKTIMDSIKPGMKLTDSTFELMWNCILNAFLKPTLKEIAGKELAKQKMINSASEEWFENVLQDTVLNIADNEVKKEENLLEHCEDAMEDIIGEVCNCLIQKSALFEIHTFQDISESAKCYYSKMESSAISEIATFEWCHELARDVIDDFFETDIVEGMVRIIGEKCIRDFRATANRKRTNDPGSSSVVLGALPLIDRYSRIRDWINQLPAVNSKISLEDSDNDPHISFYNATTVTTLTSLSGSNGSLEVSLEGSSDDDDHHDSDASISPPASLLAFTISSESNVELMFQNSETKSPKSKSSGMFASLKRRATSGIYNYFGFKRAKVDKEVVESQ